MFYLKCKADRMEFLIRKWDVNTSIMYRLELTLSTSCMSSILLIKRIEYSQSKFDINNN